MKSWIFETLAAALLKMAQGERTLIVPPDAPMRPKREFRDRDDRGPRDRNDRGPRGDREDRPRRERRDVGDMQLYRIEVAAMMVLKFVISLVRLLTKATSAAVTSVTLSCLLLTPPSNCRKVCRVKCCNTLHVLAF